MIPRLAALVLLLLAGVTAQADPLTRARACTRISEDAARLACFDAALSATNSAAATPGAAAPASAAGLPAPAPAAGASAPADPVAAFGDRGQLPAEKDKRADLPKRLNSHIRQAQSLRGGLYRLTLDNGQVWVTKESDWAVEFSSGDEVTIQRMALGGYRISHTGQGRNVAIGRVL